MERAFITREPIPTELDLVKKFLGSYRDGSGNNREIDGTTRADFRQIERCFAEFLHGKTTENKAFYDFVVESNESGGIAFRGVSVKSKELTKLAVCKNLNDALNLRAHLEISNSSAKDWELCREYGLSEDDFRKRVKAEEFGKVILERQKIERELSEERYIQSTTGIGNKFFIPIDCIFISVLYTKLTKGERRWMINSFPIILPKPEKWEFRAERKGKRTNSCVIGLDTNNEVVYEWYALSGSQFKYYPKIETRTHGTDLFLVPKPTIESLRAKITRLFGD